MKTYGIMCVNEALQSHRVYYTPGYDTLEQAQRRCEELAAKVRKFVYHQPVELKGAIAVGQKVQGRE